MQLGTNIHYWISHRFLVELILLIWKAILV